MTDAISIKDIQAQQDALQVDFEKTQEVMQDAIAICNHKKAILVKFNNKYGRVLQMMKED